MSVIGSQNIQALQQGFAALSGSAQRLARPGQAPDLVAEQVLQLNVRRSAEAQVKLLQAQDDLLGTLIDLRA
jgi:hypothetical protein